MKCRCGHEGNKEHPCHGKGYICGKPSIQRFYNAKPATLAGSSMKFDVMETWACDECWEAFSKDLAYAHKSNG